MVRAVAMCTAVMVFSGTTAAMDQWQFQAGPAPLATMWTAVNEGKAEWLSSAGLSWPDGRQSVVIYFRRDKTLWRCVEHFTVHMEFNGTGCYVLKANEGKER